MRLPALFRPPVPDQRRNPHERSARLAVLGMLWGLLSLLAATQFEFDWLAREMQAWRSPPAQQPPPAAQQEPLTASSITWAGSSHTYAVRTPSPNTPPPTHPAWNWAAKALGTLAVAFALAGLWRQEHWRAVMLTLALGVGGIAFHGVYTLASAILPLIALLLLIGAFLGMLG